MEHVVHFHFGECFRKYVMIGAPELFVKTCGQMWEDSDTPPVLKESEFHFRSEQNLQRMPAGNFIIAIPVQWAWSIVQGIAATCH